MGSSSDKMKIYLEYTHPAMEGVINSTDRNVVINGVEFEIVQIVTRVDCYTNDISTRVIMEGKQ